MIPQIKIYNIDYKFIISNYLDVSLWKKEWTLLIYKEHQFTIRLYKIMCGEKEICFQIKKNGYYSSQYVDYNLENTSIDILKKQINGALFRLIEEYEINELRGTKEYEYLTNNVQEERDKLRDIAIDFLNDEGVSNEDIREAYIDNYVNKNEHLYDLREDYLRNMKYSYLPDLFIVFCKITNDKDRLYKVIQQINNRQLVKNLMIEINEYIDNLDSKDYEDEMKDRLEGV